MALIFFFGGGRGGGNFDESQARAQRQNLVVFGSVPRVEGFSENPPAGGKKSVKNSLIHGLKHPPRQNLVGFGHLKGGTTVSNNFQEKQIFRFGIFPKIAKNTRIGALPGG